MVKSTVILRMTVEGAPDIRAILFDRLIKELEEQNKHFDLQIEVLKGTADKEPHIKKKGV